MKCIICEIFVDSIIAFVNIFFFKLMPAAFLPSVL